MAPAVPGRSEGTGDRGRDERGSAILDSPPSRGAKVVEDAADDAAFGDEGDHPHHARAAGTDERIDLVNPADELGLTAPKST